MTQMKEDGELGLLNGGMKAQAEAAPEKVQEQPTNGVTDEERTQGTIGGMTADEFRKAAHEAVEQSKSILGDRP